MRNRRLARLVAGLPVLGLALVPSPAHAAITDALCAQQYPCQISVSGDAVEGKPLTVTIAGAPKSSGELRAWSVQVRPDGSFDTLVPFSDTPHFYIDASGQTSIALRPERQTRQPQTSGWLYISPMDANPTAPRERPGYLRPSALR